jgi:glucan phosphoethanolaminetransferase (alkaline phosphatase superfamily)
MRGHRHYQSARTLSARSNPLSAWVFPGWGKAMPLLRNNITIIKIICLALMFAPLWGLGWFRIDLQVNWVLSVLEAYFITNLKIGVIYMFICVLAFCSFVIVAFIRAPIVRLPLMFIMLIGWGFELCILDLNGTPSSQNLFWILWQEWTTAPEAVNGYSFNILRDCAVVLVLGIALCASPSRRFSVSATFGFLPLASIILVASTIIYTKGGTQIFPIPFGTFSNASIVVSKAIANPQLPFDSAPSDTASTPNLTITGEIHPIFDKIIVIMDESVRGDYLSLNNPRENTTPFLKTIDGLINFGLASSGANCSAISRTIFRFGMREIDLPESWQTGLRRPTFWQFARRAGYKTVHIDAWYGPLTLGNGFSLPEELLIDSKISVIENPSYLRDRVLVDKLLHALEEEGPEFIYVEKFGTHFPYSDKYPPDFKLLTKPHESHLLPVGGSYRADYRKAVAWSVDEFFSHLLPDVDLSKTLVIYTSDHGQNMLPGRITHCSTTPTVPPGEEIVPLFAITSVPDFEQRLKKGATRSFGRFSHFEIFPTLLLAMGYEPDWVMETYGPSLMDRPPPDRKFMIGSPGFQPMMISVDRNSTRASSAIEPHQVPMSKARGS